MKHGRVATIALALVVVCGCAASIDHEHLKLEIRDLHEGFIQAHLDKDAALIAAPTADEYLFVARGEVIPMTASDVEARLAPYLAETEFSIYEDVAEPIIGVSEDGSVAWSIVQVRVAGERTGDDGTIATYDTLWAWLSLYRRDSDGWVKITDVSTNRPFDTQ